MQSGLVLERGAGPALDLERQHDLADRLPAAARLERLGDALEGKRLRDERGDLSLLEEGREGPEAVADGVELARVWRSSRWAPVALTR